MILVDTCVWVEHLRGRRRARDLRTLLDEDRVLTHSWIVGELALGRLGSKRRGILRDLALLPSATRVRDEEVMEMIDARSLSGSGIGWVDAHLLASTLVTDSRLWTFDTDLDRAAHKLGIDHRLTAK
jgi:predicted nucleic acid-binding protein